MTTLNTAAFTTVWDDNFAAHPYIDSSIFPNRWGASSEFYASNGGLTVTDNGTAAGFMRADSGASSGDGYGLYSVTFKANSLATGAYICLWPSTNKWPGPEIDLYETMNNKPYLTVHWKGSNGSNQYSSTFMPTSGVNWYGTHTIAVDWESGKLTFFLDGQQVAGYTSANTPISADYAHGGQNEAFGVGLQSNHAGASITLYDMHYGKPNGASPVASGTGGGNTTPISISAPGTVTGTTPYTESITFSDAGLANQTIYAVVMNSANQFEENWIPITLNSSGVASHAMTFQHSGDYMIAVSNTGTQANKGVSSKITINAPSAGGTTPTPSSWISISDPGTVAGPAPVHETIHFSDPGLSGVYALVMNSSNQGEGGWNWVPFSNGGGSASLTFQHSGDYVLAVANTSTLADKSWSSKITIS